MLYQTFRPLNHHLRHPLVVLRQFIKSRVNNLHIISRNGFPDIGHFLRALVNQQDDQVHIFIILQNRFGNVFQQCCLSGFRRGYDHASLPFSDWGNHIYNPHGNSPAFALHHQAFIRENRRHIFKIITF